MSHQAGIQGFEVNVFSRFVDHSCVTPFEVLCHDIERLFMSWISSGIFKRDSDAKSFNAHLRYDDNKYVVTFINQKNDINSAVSVNAVQLCSKELFSCFSVSKYVILTTDGHWVNVTQSSSQVLFSALIIAMNSCNVVDIPVFFANLDISRIDLSTRKLLGYRVNDHKKFKSTTMFESHIMEGVNCSHELYFLDGIAKLFESKVALACNIFERFSSLNATCRVTETFLCQPLQSHYVDLKFPFETQSTQPMIRLQDLRLIWKAFPSYLSSNSLLTEILICFEFLNIRSDAFVDNCKYTTLQISQQPPDSWNVKVTYKPFSEAAIVQQNVNENDKIDFSTSLSSGLRRLLSAYIYASVDGQMGSQSESAGSILKTNTFSINKKQKKSIIDKNIEKAFYIAEQISPHLNTALKEICTVTSHKSLFRESLSSIFLAIDDLNRESNSNDKSISFSLFELFSVYLSGYPFSVQHIVLLWSEFIDELNEYFGRVSSRLPSVIIRRTNSHRTTSRNSMMTEKLWQQNVEDKMPIYIDSDDDKSGILSQLVDGFCLYSSFKYEYLFESSAPAAAHVCANQPQEEDNCVIHGIAIVNPKLQLRPFLPLNGALLQSLSHHSVIGKNDIVQGSFERKLLLLITSDIQSFKSANPDIDSFDIFWVWYSDIQQVYTMMAISSIFSKHDVEMIWDGCAAVTVEDQVSVYLWEEEAEIALDLLRGVSPSVLARDAIVSALRSFYIMLRHEVTSTSTITKSKTSVGDQSNESYTSFLQSELDNLKLQIDEVTRLCQEEGVGTNEQTTVSNALVDDDIAPELMSLICKIDLIAERMNVLEEYIIRSKEVCSILFPSVSVAARDGDAVMLSLLHKVCRPSSQSQSQPICLESSLEVTDILNVVKQVSIYQNNNHNDSAADSWMGVDGRDLGWPTQKVLEVTCDSKFDLNSRSFVHTKSTSPRSAHELLPIRHHMKVDIQNKRAVISSSFEEIDL